MFCFEMLDCFYLNYVFIVFILIINYNDFWINEKYDK
ncbi:Uncharacterised protein [Myroides odoratus]|uniref:Uncharacterized protein n=1 Tax=Myroides odoratus TaxID=256 RepID=A0A378RN18_MYROD|nr:Uncharacterised protein [Myroides odoratus]